MGTMQGSVSPEHLPAYFDEWVFRFNRRNSRSRGLLFHTLMRQAVEGQPVTYKSLRKAGRTRPARRQPARSTAPAGEPGRRAPRTSMARLTIPPIEASLGVPRWRPLWEDIFGVTPSVVARSIGLRTDR